MTTVAIIQARMTGSRLPNKVLLHLNGYPIIEWVYRRVKKSELIDKIVFAITDSKQDDVLARFLESKGANVFRGDENNLVDRYCQAAKSVLAKEIVRITADCPLVCASEIDRLVNFFHHNTCDYAYNHIPKNNLYPDGLGGEICKMETLIELQSKEKTAEQREHLFNFIWDYKDQYTIKTFNPPAQLSYPDLKLDIDTMDDYKFFINRNYEIDMNAEEIISESRLNKSALSSTIK